MNDDEKFKKHLNQSQGAVWKVAQYLSSKGHPVTVPPTFVAPSHEEWEEYADDGDIYMGQRIEVKQRGFIFSGRGDWPYETFIVCAKHSFDRAKPKPYAYFVLSKDGNHAAVVRGDTHKQWYSETKKDLRYDNMVQSFYMCPLNLVKFITL